MTFVLTTLFCFLIGFLFVIDLTFFITTDYPLSYQLYLDYKIKKNIDKYLSDYCGSYKYFEIFKLNNLSFDSDKRISRVCIIIKNNLVTSEATSNKYISFFFNINLRGNITNMEDFIEEVESFDRYCKNNDSDFKSKLLVETRNEKLKKLDI